MKYYNKINRNFKVITRLYLNEKSHNRTSDSTPRFFVKIKSLKTLERIGFTSEAEDQSYLRYQENFYGGKQEKYLNDTLINDIVKDLNERVPYGFNTEVSGSENAYDNAVKYDAGYQSFYHNFWYNNLDLVKTEDGETYPFIEVDLNEPVRSKHLSQVPSSFAPSTISYEYTGQELGLSGSYNCFTGSDLAVSLGYAYNTSEFTLDGALSKNLILGKHKQYTFTNTNTGFESTNHSGILPFRISAETPEGEHDKAIGGSTFTSGVSVSRAGALHGSETLTLTTDEHTPSILYYYSPLSSGMSVPMAVLPDCSGVSGSVSHSSSADTANWNTGTTASISGSYTVISSTGGVTHGVTNYVRGWNSYPNSDVSDTVSGQDYKWIMETVPRLPAYGANDRVPIGAIGVALNGLPIYNPYDATGGNYVTSAILDDCNGHVRSGKYHYYNDPSCTYVDVSGEHSPIVGYAFDGYPIYGPREDNGLHIDEDELDEHHGHTQEGRGYHYHITTGAPYVLGAYYRGTAYSGNYTSSEDPPISAYPTKYQSL